MRNTEQVVTGRSGSKVRVAEDIQGKRYLPIQKNRNLKTKPTKMTKYKTDGTLWEERMKQIQTEH